MRNWMAKLMAGRNGADALSRFTSILACALLVISFILPEALQTLFLVLAVAAVFCSYFRTFSRNIGKRRGENEKYLLAKARASSALRCKKDQWNQRKIYCFFKCPSCGAGMRVPKDKGKIRITCRKCGEAFTKKT